MGEAEAPDREKPQGSWRVNVGSTCRACSDLFLQGGGWNGAKAELAALELLLLVPRPKNWLLRQSQGALRRDDRRGSEAKPRGPLARAAGITDGRPWGAALGAARGGAQGGQVVFSNSSNPSVKYQMMEIPWWPSV